MLVPPLATAVGDPLTGAVSPPPCSTDGMKKKKKTAPLLSLSLRWMTSETG
jgi:hypothetical protein